MVNIKNIYILATVGGAIYLKDSKLNVENSTFNFNTASKLILIK